MKFFISLFPFRVQIADRTHDPSRAACGHGDDLDAWDKGQQGSCRTGTWPSVPLLLPVSIQLSDLLK